jgi:methylenetetrahydrofolate reductase (NADH)
MAHARGRGVTGAAAKQVDAALPGVHAVAELVANASIELGVRDTRQLAAARRFLPPGKKHFVSFLPDQAWRETLDACIALTDAGFQPVPHVPVRLLESREALAQLLRDLSLRGGVSDLLLISGDYSKAIGPYSCVADVLRTNLLGELGFSRVSFAGHPEGHPQVAADEISRAEIEKARLAESQGLEATFVTQFSFEPQPLFDWLDRLRSGGFRGRAVAGIAGPARTATLLKYAVRCGIGPSIRALRSRPGAAAMLLADHGPEAMLAAIANAKARATAEFGGVHMFSFGGYLQTAEWIHRTAHRVG